MDVEQSSNHSDTDWIKVKQLSSLLLIEWSISAFTEKVSASLMQEEYDSLYKTIRLSIYSKRFEEPVIYDYPIRNSAGKMQIPVKFPFQAFQLKLLFYNSSNLKLIIAKTPDVPIDPSQMAINPSYPGCLIFSAYTEYGE
ncbi:hypothetical protein CEF21_15635 [Bacillus sp. FJAT-42376]|uniref:hypothetical protein n=1 Tax=Bacillus sp. FJAT-42376 TaxID=2014076 RepID=UPI000F4FAB47|nr:hypothetical protein [Bacillus sp. FJAT-42376]AZB43623.1 hypothetical protein CEF21_15635 [Bacillus sp. FJAT-42376]